VTAKNTYVWVIGKDDGSTGFDFVLEQDDGEKYPLFRIEPGGDATAVGMVVASLDMRQTAGARWLFRGEEES
jgi:hypothetical protein